MNHSLDAPETIFTHRNIIRNNGFLRKIYIDFYNKLKPTDLPNGPIIEIGSGGGFIKEIIPQVITSDIVKGPDIDLVFSALDLPFADNSISAFLMLNVFHHIKDPERALNEMRRCLKLGGKIIMVEPYNSLWSRFFYKNFHYEGFDTSAKWKIDGDRRLSDANNALPWIVFVRDREKFLRKFPDLKIYKVEPHTPFGYLISGGLTRESILPANFYSSVKFIEGLLSPLKKIFSMFATIEVIKQTKN